jgi:lipopolysaccharide export system protein LptC
MMNSSTHPLPVVLLLLLAVVTGYMVWQLSEDEAPPPLYGPPRSDYVLIDFEMVSLDEKGVEAFSAQGPMLSRHPYLGTLDVEKPRFLFPDSKGQPWNARAGRAWVAKDGSELRLTQAVEFDGPRDAAGARIEVRTPDLTVLPEVNEVKTDSAVTVTGPGSILRGRGLHADLDTRRFKLARMTGHYAPPKR